MTFLLLPPLFFLEMLGSLPLQRMPARLALGKMAHERQG